MRMLKITGLALMCVFLAAAVPARAQDQNQHKQETKKPARQAHAKPAQHGRQATRSTRTQTRRTTRPATRSARTQTRRTTRPATRTARTPVRRTRPVSRARPAASARYARGGAAHGRIPAARFRASFGSAHRFRISHFYMVGGHRQFVYGGYRFQIMGGWPVGWAYTSPFYIDFIGGAYWMFNPLYPGVRVAIVVI
jgi:hypothetical protein